MMHNNNNNTSPLAYFSITKQNTGEVLLEFTSNSLFTSTTSVENKCGIFSDAFAFIEAAQAQSYELFGRSMVKDSSPLGGNAGISSKRITTITTTNMNNVGQRGRRDKCMEPFISCDATSSSFLDSAEWEKEDADADSTGNNNNNNIIINGYDEEEYDEYEEENVILGDSIGCNPVDEKVDIAPMDPPSKKSRR